MIQRLKSMKRYYQIKSKKLNKRCPDLSKDKKKRKQRKSRNLKKKLEKLQFN